MEKRSTQTYTPIQSLKAFLTPIWSGNFGPIVHNGPFPDTDSKPATDPVNTFHLGLCFNSPEDAAKTGCADTVTPFNGEHNAGIQVLNTGQFAKDEGPLGYLKP